MALSNALTAPPKCLLVNVASSETMSCLFNPTELAERVGVSWNRLGVLGLSHELLQYQHTTNRQLPSVEFYLDRFRANEAPDAVFDIGDFRAFLRALTVPPEGESAPPRALIVWPKVLVVETVLTELEFRYRVFGSDGDALIYTATCSFEEILDVRVTSEDRRRG